MITDHETPWKELLEQDAERALAFFYPDIHADLDWARDVESLEQEFRKVAPEAALGKRVADKLLKHHQRGTGDPRYLHFEIQSYFEDGFPRRVYLYNSVAEIRYGQPVVSLPLLIDGDPSWLPTEYRAELYGTSRTLTFRTKKLIHYRDHVAELQADPNPVALLVLAWLEGHRLGNDYEAVLAARVRLIRSLERHGLTADEGKRWLGYFAWLLRLPKEYTARLWAELNPKDKENPMPLVSDIEEYLTEKGMEKGMEKGERRGLVKGIALGLKLKFGPEGLALLPQVEKIEGLTQIQAIYDAIDPAASLDDVRKLIPAASNG